MTNSKQARYVANRDFDEARRQAAVSQIRAWFSGADNQLIPFEVIRAQLREQNPYYVGIIQVPVDKIIGSVGRYQDFTREFLPLNNSMRERWVRVESIAMDQGWPPVELYQVGDGYFVRDGNHRVSIAKQMGNSTIEASVWKYPETVEVSTAESLNELLLRLGQTRFHERTRLDQLYPDHNIEFTVAGRYQHLLAQISQIHHNLALIDRDEVDSVADIPYEEAVRFWYECLYEPAVDIIQASGVLDKFPNRTAADLYVWFWRYREQLEKRFCGTHIGGLLEQALEENQPSAVGRVVNQVLNLFGFGNTEPLDVDNLDEDFSQE